jgi:PAS domain S-box-containing protein
MKKKIRVLHLEDDPLDHEIVKNILSESDDFIYEIECVLTKENFIKKLEKKTFDIILADYKLPSFDGLSALKIARKRFPEIPFVFISGAIGEEMAIETLKAGAKDYVIKDSYKRLIPSIKRAIMEAEERLRRKQAEESLKESQNKLSLLFDSSPEGIYTITLDGKMIEANKTFINMMQYSKDDIKEFDFLKFVSREFYEYLENMVNFVKENKYVAFEIECIKKDKTKFPVSIIKWLIHDKQGNPKEIGGFIRDITEKKQLEKEKRIHEEMSNQLERVTALSHLSSVITHEIKQPLQSIKVIADSILYLNKKDKKLSYKEVLGDLSHISDRVDRINNIINSIRSLIKAPNLLEIKNIDIVKQIKNSIKFLKEKLKNHNIDIKLDFSKNIIYAVASEIQFQQVIINLVDNAIFALDKINKKNKKIVIQTSQVESSVIIEVSDNGIGIKEENINKIFDAFYTFSEKIDRMGMGLYIVNNIIKCFGGKIEVENNNLGGANFIIFLNRK